MPFFQLYSITKDKKFFDIGKLICDNYTRFQNNDGSFIIHENTKTINLHTQSYALEGLLFAFSFTKKQDYLESCVRALDWCQNQIEDDGSIMLWFNFKDKSKAIYPIAQIIRLMILIDKINETKEYSNSIDKLIKFIFTLQAQTEEIHTNGGFYEEFYKTLFGWKKDSN